MKKKKDYEQLISYVRYQCFHGLNLNTALKNLDYEYKGLKMEENEMNGMEELNVTNEYNLTESQKRIETILDGMKDVLLYKNKKYGDSALHPNNVFYKGDSTNSIMIRLDDKIGRIKNNSDEKPRVNDVADIIGYCTLLLVSMNVTEDDLEKLKD